MRVHLTGVPQGSIRVAGCKNVPDACKDFYQAERDREEAKAREREAKKTGLYNEAAKLTCLEMDKKRKAEVEPCCAPNPLALQLTMTRRPRSLIENVQHKECCLVTCYFKGPRNDKQLKVSLLNLKLG